MNSSAADDPVDLPVEAQPNPPDQEYANMFVQDGKQPQASSTPEKEIRVKKRCRILQKEKAYLRKEMLNLKRQLAATKQTSEKLRKSLERLKKGKKTVSERNKPMGTKKLALERKEEVVKFLCRDENSRLLPGKKDTITKNKNKQQRRVLTKSLTELHVQYNSEIKKPFSLSSPRFSFRRKQETGHSSHMCGLYSTWMSVICHHLFIPSARRKCYMGPLRTVAEGCEGEVQSSTNNFTCHE